MMDRIDGCSFAALIQLRNGGRNRDRYIFQLEVDDDCGDIGLLVDAADALTLEWGTGRTRCENFVIPWDDLLVVIVTLSGSADLWVTQLHINGRLEAESVSRNHLSFDALGHLTIGSRADETRGGFFALAEYSIFAKALSETERTRMTEYLAKRPGQPGLKAAVFSGSQSLRTGRLSDSPAEPPAPHS